MSEDAEVEFQSSLEAPNNRELYVKPRTEMPKQVGGDIMMERRININTSRREFSNECTRSDPLYCQSSCYAYYLHSPPCQRMELMYKIGADEMVLREECLRNLV